MVWHVKRLGQQLEEEKKAHDAAMAKIKQQQASQRARMKAHMPRRH